MEITIRRAEPEDYEAIQRIFSGPRVVWGTLQLPFQSVDSWRKRMAEPPEGFYSLVATVEGEVIGQLGLMTFPNRPRRRHLGEVGMMVRDDWQGKGVGSELMQAALDLADKWLNLTRLELQVYTDNAPAIRLYRKFGFVVEGTRRKDAFREGKYVDTLAMARLRDEATGQADSGAENTKQRVSTGSPYEPLIGISRAVRIGNHIAIAGTAPLDVDGKTMGKDDPAAQARRCFEISRLALEKLGATLNDVIRTRILLKRIEDWRVVAEVHGELFRDIRPVNTVMQVSQFIDPDWLIETEVDAIVNA